IGRREFCRQASLAGLGWVAAEALASADGPERTGRARALILLWLDGGPSQLETFDPQPGTEIGGPTEAIATAIPGVRFAAGLPQLARAAGSLAVVRSLTSREGDHERGRYFLKTGYRMNPSVVHPAVGAIAAAEMADNGSELPRFVSILAKDRETRGGY